MNKGALKFFPHPSGAASDSELEGTAREIVDRGRASQSASPARSDARTHSFKLAGLLCLEVVALNIAALPATMNFNFWAFDDQGANLVVQHLIKQGYRPAVDFTYHYGLLPLLFGKVWFGGFGATPGACLAAMALCAMVLAWALARIASTARVGPAGIVLIIIALPLTIPLPAPNLAHVLEAALLSSALAEQLAGRRSSALALAAASSFAKPSMAYIYGLALVILIVRDLRLKGRLQMRPLIRHLLPAIVTEIGLAAALAAIYSPDSVAYTLVPITGLRLYEAMHFGFFHAARGFWYFPGVHLTYYLGTVAGFWIASTIWLFACGLIALCKMNSPQHSHAGSLEVIFCCALMQLAFISLFFGGFFSWFYYAYMLVIGLALTVTWGPVYRYVVFALLLLALVGQKTEVAGVYRAWRTTSPGAQTASLWASPAESKEWAKVLAIVKTQRGARLAAILDVEGAAPLLFPGFAPPVSLYLVAGAMHSDVVRKFAQVSAAPVVVMPRARPLQNPILSYWPILKRALTNHRLIWKGRFFKVYAKTADGGSPAA